LHSQARQFLVTGRQQDLQCANSRCD